MFEELFRQYPGLQNLYENAIANGYTGDPQQLLREYGQDFSNEIGGLGAALGVQPQPSLMPQGMAQAVQQQAMPAQQMMPQQTMPMPQAMIDPTVMAYQRGLLSGSIQPQNPYGFGLATSPYVGYPRNPYGSLLY
jgi:hypothetical protein